MARAAARLAAATAAVLLLVAGAHAAPLPLNVQRFGAGRIRSSAQYVLPGCTFMWEPGQSCVQPDAAGRCVGCCPLGFVCGETTKTCDVDPSLEYTVQPTCTNKLKPGDTCGSVTGPNAGACCPDGFQCVPKNYVPGRPFVCDITRRCQVPDYLLYDTLYSSGAVPGYNPFPKGFDEVQPPIHVKGNKFLTNKGELVQLRGFNWFGFATGVDMVDGLWAFEDGETSKRTMTNDFSTVLLRQRALGFNAVRLPFSFSDLQVTADTPDPNNPGQKLMNQGFYFGNCDITPFDTIKAETIPDGVTTTNAFPAYTGFDYKPNPEQTTCNYYIPKDTVINRFLFVVRHFVARGFYVNINFFPAVNDPSFTNEGQFAANWRHLWAQFVNDVGAPKGTFKKYLKGRILIDLGNEFDIAGCVWDGTCRDVNGATRCLPYKRLLNSATRAIRSLTPDQPLLFEGVGQANGGGCGGAIAGINYGDGYITDKTILAANPTVSDPSTYFKNPPSDMVIATHLYGPEVSRYGRPEDGQDPATYYAYPVYSARMDASFGKKHRGVDTTSNGRPIDKFPLVIGEFGSTLSTPGEQLFIASLTQYMADRTKIPVPVSWFWWAWNSNTDPPQGLVAQNTWRAIQWNKINALTQNGFNLKPWYL